MRPGKAAIAAWCAPRESDRGSGRNQERQHQENDNPSEIVDHDHRIENQQTLRRVPITLMLMVWLMECCYP